MFTGIIQDIGIILKINSKDYDISTKLNRIKTGDSISVNGVCLTITKVVPFPNNMTHKSKTDLPEKILLHNTTELVTPIESTTLMMESQPVSDKNRSTLSNLQQSEIPCSNGVKFTVHISKETYNITTFKYLKVGSKVNLEPSLSISDKISGHFLTGHIDIITHITDIRKVQDSFIYKFKIPQEYKKYIVKKGSIAIDGISLTIADVSMYDFSVVIIPYTYEHTTMRYRHRNDKVNIEFDILSKYVFSIIKNTIPK